MSDKLEQKYFTYDKESGSFKTKTYANESDIRVIILRGQVVDVSLIAEYSIEREWYNLKYLTPRDE